MAKLRLEIEIECVADYERATDELRTLGGRYLLAKGWQSNYGHPAGLVLYTKRVGKRTYHVGLNTALAIQRNSEPY